MTRRHRGTVTEAPLHKKLRLLESKYGEELSDQVLRWMRDFMREHRDARTGYIAAQAAKVFTQVQDNTRNQEGAFWTWASVAIDLRRLERSEERAATARLERMQRNTWARKQAITRAIGDADWDWIQMRAALVTCFYIYRFSTGQARRKHRATVLAQVALMREYKRKKAGKAGVAVG